MQAFCNHEESLIVCWVTHYNLDPNSTETGGRLLLNKLGLGAGPCPAALGR